MFVSHRVAMCCLVRPGTYGFAALFLISGVQLCCTDIQDHIQLPHEQFSKFLKAIGKFTSELLI